MMIRITIHDINATMPSQQKDLLILEHKWVSAMCNALTIYAQGRWWKNAMILILLVAHFTNREHALGLDNHAQ